MNEINEFHINSSLPMDLIHEYRSHTRGRWCYHCGDTLVGVALYRRWRHEGRLRHGCLCRSCEAIEAAQIAAETNEIETMERRRDDE
jgi:hypothetical protein